MSALVQRLPVDGRQSRGVLNSTLYSNPVPDKLLQRGHNNQPMESLVFGCDDVVSYET